MIKRRLVQNARQTAQLPGGLKLSVKLADELATSYLLGKEFEPDTVDFLQRFLQPGDVVLDIGANIGHMSIVAAAKVGAHGKVLAFEPAPAEFAELNLNIQLNSLTNIEPHALAIADAPGRVPFYLAGEGLGLYNSTGKPFRTSGMRQIEVEAVRLDDFLKENDVPAVTLVKMDVEGGELAVLRGGDAFFRRDDGPLVICEFSDVASSSTGQTTEQLWTAFENHGYTLFDLVPTSGTSSLREAILKRHYD